MLKHPSLEHIEHRPYALPEKNWIMRQSWTDLLFAHWVIDVQLIRAHVPVSLEIDLFDGVAYIAVVPFAMRDVMAGALPALPYFSNFLELNVRTYVVHKGIKGVYFFSLDASNTACVLGARMSFGLPYYKAIMEMNGGGDGGATIYSSKRVDHSAASFSASYRPTGAAFTSGPGSIEHFLTERYCLFVERGNQIWRADIHHAPWTLQLAEAEISVNTMTAPLGFQLPIKPDLLHYSPKIQTIEWLPGLSK